jgi:hypothetical protein
LSAGANPRVVIISIQDFIRTAAPAPDWLDKAWRGAKRRGLDKLTSADIDGEIVAYRREKKRPSPTLVTERAAISAVQRGSATGSNWSDFGARSEGTCPILLVLLLTDNSVTSRNGRLRQSARTLIQLAPDQRDQ